MTVASLSSLIVTIAVVLAFCIPFFIFKIRNQVVEMNNKLTRIVTLLEAQLPEEKIPIFASEKDKNIKICPKCGRKNRAEEWNCEHCGEALISIDASADDSVSELSRQYNYKITHKRHLK